MTVQGSVLSLPQPDLSRVRATLKQQLRTAWSQEAVKRGVVQAQGGHHMKAIQCYQQAGGDTTSCGTASCSQRLLQGGRIVAHLMAARS